MSSFQGQMMSDQAGLAATVATPATAPADKPEIATFEAAQGLVKHAVDVAGCDVREAARLLLIAAAQLVWERPLHEHGGPVADMLVHAVAEALEAYLEPVAKAPRS